MITYKGNRVLLDGKIVGTIEPHDSGWFYKPKGVRKFKPDPELIFQTINEVMQSIEGDV